MKRQEAKLKLNKQSIKLLDDQRLVDLRGGRNHLWRNCPTCIKKSCNTATTDMITAECIV